MRHDDGPFFEEFRLGMSFPGGTVALTEGLASAHRAVVGDWSLLGTHSDLARHIGRGRPPAPPHLVWDLSIGHSTVATREVKANLFYRNLSFHRIAAVGDEISSITRVVGLKPNRPRDGQRTGLVLLNTRTVDQGQRTVLDYVRCALIPFRHASSSVAETTLPDLSLEGVQQSELVAEWNLSALPSRSVALTPGDAVATHGDVISGAPELVRITGNRARVHSDSSTASGRLVYGGHTIGVVYGQACRALPNLLWPVAWQSCDHVGPVREGDTVVSEHTVLSNVPFQKGLRLVTIESVGFSSRGDARDEVLRWVWQSLSY